MMCLLTSRHYFPASAALSNSVRIIMRFLASCPQCTLPMIETTCSISDLSTRLFEPRRLHVYAVCSRLSNRRRINYAECLLRRKPCSNGLERCMDVGGRQRALQSRALSPASVNALSALSTAYCLPYFALAFMQMLVAPKWDKTQRVMEQDIIFIPIALAYLILLVHSWQPDTVQLVLPGSLKAGFTGGFKPQFIPSLTGIATLFSRLTTAASLWVHLLAINLFAASRTYLEGRRQGLPTRHTTLLCMVFGPLGLVSSALTTAWRPSSRLKTS